MDRTLIIMVMIIVLVSMLDYNCFIRKDTKKYYVFIFENKLYRQMKKLEKFVKRNKLIGYKYGNFIVFEYTNNLHIGLWTDTKTIGIFDENSRCLASSFWKDKSDSIYDILIQNEIKDSLENYNEVERIIGKTLLD